MSSKSTSGPSLEVRYRRWLRAYPADHRRRYADEMIGVLLATAEPGRQRPRPREVIDLVRGGLVVRSRHSLAHYRGDDWRDAIALVGLLAPMVLLAGLLRYGIDATLLTRQLIVTADRLGGPTAGPGWLVNFHTMPLWLAGGAAALFAMLGLRRTAAICAFAMPVLITCISLLVSFRLGVSAFQSFSYPVMALLGLLTGIALLLSGDADGDGDRRPAVELMGGRPGVALAAAGATMLGVLSARTAMLTVVGGSGADLSILVLFAVPAMAALLLVRTRPGRRALALLLVPFSPLLITLADGLLQEVNAVGISDVIPELVLYLLVVPFIALVTLFTVPQLAHRTADTAGGEPAPAAPEHGGA